MRKINRIAIAAVTTITLLAAGNTASAGEPFHPIYEPTYNFFRWLFGF
jgi:hypothetical protein